MRLHPEYNELIMTFYAKMFDKYPYNEKDPFDFESKPRTSIERQLDELVDLTKLNQQEREAMNKSLDEIIWDLGMNLPSWDDDDEEESK